MRLDVSWAGQRSIDHSVDVAVKMTAAAAHGVGSRRQRAAISARPGTAPIIRQWYAM
jgi:hypothetical protein